MRRFERNLKRVIGAALAACLVLGALPAQAAGSKRFSDVKEQDWFYSFVEELSGQGIVSGYPDGSFQPQKNVTVGEVLSLVMIATGHGVQTKTGAHWSSGFADYALRNGYLTAGLEQDLDAEMKRLEVAQLVAKAMKLVPPKGTASPFVDTENGYANILYQKGILAGSLEGGNRVFKPDDPITRAEISAIIWRINNYS